jgi:hypothetical protein
MRILRADNYGFEFERAFVGEVSGVPKPVAIMSGVVCNIDTDSDSLANGLASCEPLQPRMAREWPMSVVVDRGHGKERLWNCTADPKVVAAAEVFAAMKAAGVALVGSSIDVNPFDACRSQDGGPVRVAVTG